MQRSIKIHWFPPILGFSPYISGTWSNRKKQFSDSALKNA